MEQENLDDLLERDPFGTAAVFEMELGVMHRYAKAAENFLTEQAEKIWENAPIPFSKMNKDEIYEFCEAHEADIYQLQILFPNILRYSLFVYSYSFFERAMLRIVEYERRYKKLPLSINDLAG